MHQWLSALCLGVWLAGCLQLTVAQRFFSVTVSQLLEDPPGVNVPLATEDKRKLVDLHNAWRRATAKGLTKDSKGKDQPRAANMNKLVWNNRLAERAEEWALQCSSDYHDPDQSFFGENMAAGHLNASLELLAGVWFNEIIDRPGRLDCQYDQFTNSCIDAGHYTQTIWAKTRVIGCGMAECNDTIRLYCRYLPAGNFIDASIYLEGEPCSRCMWDQQCEDGLCIGGQKGPASGEPKCGEKKENSSCNFWSSNGFCTRPVYAAYMAKECARSCGWCPPANATESA